MGKIISGSETMKEISAKEGLAEKEYSKQ